MKLKVPVYAVCIVSILVLQSTVLDYIRVYNVKPNLIVIFVVSVALLNGNVEGAAVGFFAGLAQDMVSGKLIGFYSLLGLYLGLTTGSMNKRLFRENVFVVIFFTFISTIVYESVVYLLWSFGSIIRGQVNLLYPLKNVIIPEAIYNSAISIFIYIFVMKLSERFEEAERKQGKY